MDKKQDEVAGIQGKCKMALSKWGISAVVVLVAILSICGVIKKYERIVEEHKQEIADLKKQVDEIPLVWDDMPTREITIDLIKSEITGIGELAGGTDHIGILFGLGAAVLYATVILLNKFIKNVEGIHRTFLQFLAAILVLVPYVMMTSGMTLGNLNGIGWINLLIVGLIHTGVTYCMYFSSLKELPGQKAAILSYIDPLVAVLISVTLLGESMTLPQLVGGILVLGFTLWNELN